jgi:hypothetical protein
VRAAIVAGEPTADSGNGASSSWITASETGKSDKGEPLEINAIWSSVLVNEGNQWKIKQLTSFPKAAPAKQ